MAATLSELTLRARALEARATASEQALDEQGDVLNELAALTRKALDGIHRIDERAERIEEDLVELRRSQIRLEAGMAQVLARLELLTGDN
ncbi:MULTISPECIES: hypothetical protein [Nocardia]|uniref:Uncharacterized protein n=2 Tax=Nocardia TaxID=1817 RepID=K0F2E7_NOCB7|nr:MULTISPECIES: hypothetical protein [Nocardia]AFU03285.1 hypothetical protein O3I_026680 [Nocardia brasiliensis ATCC 700358]ASF06742.1 hypothetical protein CEQ30_04675 [Nocardia brasiliensis]KIA61200.1 hypothetical protein FG87_32190 [Nocardia vulneris]MBF6125920.1 hypothetical protein [Nocardia brasiliensis]MBF6543075.1 hypothetical protein [Nocardia brasiliensis]